MQARHSQWRPMCGRAKRRWSIIPSTGLCPEPHKGDRSHQAQTSSQPQNRLHSNAAVAQQKLAQKQVRCKHVPLCPETKCRVPSSKGAPCSCAVPLGHTRTTPIGHCGVPVWKRSTGDQEAPPQDTTRTTTRTNNHRVNSTDGGGYIVSRNRWVLWTMTLPAASRH